MGQHDNNNTAILVVYSCPRAEEEPSRAEWARTFRRNLYSTKLSIFGLVLRKQKFFNRTPQGPRQRSWSALEKTYAHAHTHTTKRRTHCSSCNLFFVASLYLFICRFVASLCTTLANANCTLLLLRLLLRLLRCCNALYGRLFGSPTYYYYVLLSSPVTG